MNNLLSFKSFFHYLGKHKLYAVINVCGLSVSLLFVILIAVYSAQEFSTDTFHEKGNRIYLLANTGGTMEKLRSFYGTAFRLAEQIAGRYPEIEAVCPVAYPMSGKGTIPVRVHEARFKAQLTFADPNFFSVFSFPLLEGEPSLVLKDKYNVVVSESFARKAFAHGDPVGQRIALSDSMTVTVSGVMKDIRNSVVPAADVIVRIDNVGHFNPGMDSPTFNNAGSALIYILAKEGADLQAKAGDMTSFFKEIFWLYQRGIFGEVAFVPLKEVYFSGIDGGGMINSGTRMFVLILLAGGIFILLFAVINYINLTTAQVGFRAKEMGVRRLLGSGRGELFLRLILESTLLSLISFGVGLLLAFAFETYVGNLLETPLFITALISPLSLLAGLALIVMLGIAAGLVPATIISRTKPVDVMKGNLRTKNKMVFSKILITFQNVITILLLASSITMIRQANHLAKAPMGYNTKNIISVPLNYEGGSGQSLSVLADELRAVPYVGRTSFCTTTPFSLGYNNTFEYEGRNVSMQQLTGDSSYLEILGIEILRDNGLEAGSGWYFSEYALKELNRPEDVDVIHFSEYWKVNVAGVVKDFQLRDVTYPQEAVAVVITEDADWSNLLVEVTGNPATAYKAVGEVYERVMRMEFDGSFLDRQIAGNFASQVRTAKIVSIFGGIAVIISSLGLLSMSSYFVRNRSREIAVRKVFGSGNRKILLRLTGSFLVYVAIAFCMATPVAWYLMREWLSGYSYRIALSPLIFLSAGLFCLAVSFVSVLWQSYKAANLNPITGLKSE